MQENGQFEERESDVKVVRVCGYMAAARKEYAECLSFGDGAVFVTIHFGSDSLVFGCL
jgi:hypothetical protein